MATSNRRDVSADDADDLDAMMDRMGGFGASSARPAPLKSPAFPSRSSSRASNHSRLSTQSSSRSLQSALSFPTAPAHSRLPPPSTSARAGSSTTSLGLGEEEATPVVAQLEWAARGGESPHSSPSVIATLNDDNVSLLSGFSGSDRPATPVSPTFFANSRRSPPPTHLPYSPTRTSSASRLIPRSPLNDRVPFAEQDLDFLQEAPKSDDGRSMHSLSSSTRGGVSSSADSMRARRIREDIERTAQRLRSSESLKRQAQAESAHAQTKDDGDGGSVASGPPPSLAAARTLTPTGDGTSDATSVFSASTKDRGSTSAPSTSGLWPQSYSSTKDSPDLSSPLRSRPREMKEWSQSCWIWQRSPISTSSGGMLGKAPLIRDVPSAMKRKMGASKRESSHLMSPTEALMFGLDDDRPRSKSSREKDKDKSKDRDGDKSSHGVSLGPGSTAKDGSWRRVTATLRDDGYFRVFSEEKFILHSVHLPSMSRFDVRLVDRSLFDNGNCIVIYRRHASPATPFMPIFNPSSLSSAPGSPKGRAVIEDPLYLRLPSSVSCQSWLVMTHCFAKPEYIERALPTTPRPVLHERRSRIGLGSGEDPGVSALERPDDDVSDTLCRVYRSLYVSISEGKGVGERGVETIRRGPKSSIDSARRGFSDDGKSSMASVEGAEASPSKKSIPMPKIGSRSYGGDSKDEHSISTFCEVVLEGEVIARTSERKATSSPFFNESFSFTDLPSFIEPLTIRVWQTHKTSRPTLVGACTVRIPDLPRAEMVESWWPLRSPTYDEGSLSNETVGELSLGIRINEDVVLPRQEHNAMLELLSTDENGDLPLDIAQELPSVLEDVSRLLLRIYQAENLFLARVLTLAEREIDKSAGSAAILFRGNTILTKSIELYMRLIGQDYLEASIGPAIRHVCAEKVELEIDPSKMKSSVKDKEVQSNARELQDVVTIFWNSIYDARQQCPADLRRIFNHIQNVVADKYGEDQKNTRWTSVSAFIFLRFFVPAVLNPKLFSLVNTPPSPKCQRTLTLVAKTLQGLANFSSFGQKEPWMLPMSAFVQDHTSAFIDFTEYIASPSASPVTGQDWTSPSAPAYFTAYQLRSSLAPLAQEGIPLLPHLIDVSRDLGLLASHVARGIADRTAAQSAAGGRNSPSGSSTKSVQRSAIFSDFIDVCVDVRDEAHRRGGPLYGASVGSLRLDPQKSRARAATFRQAGGAWSAKRSTLSNVSAAMATRGLPITDDVIHIRSPVPPTRSNGPSPDLQMEASAAADGPIRPQSSPEPGHDRTASRKSHRSFTINGTSPRRASLTQAPSTDSEGEGVAPSFVPAGFADALRHTSAIPLTSGSPRMGTVPAAISDVFFDAPARRVSDEDQRADGPPGYSFPPVTRSIQVSQETSTSVSLLDEEQRRDGGSVDLQTAYVSSVPMRATNSTSSWTSSISSSTSAISVLAEVSTGAANSSSSSRRGSVATTSTGGADEAGLPKEKKKGGFFMRRKGSKQ